MDHFEKLVCKIEEKKSFYTKINRKFSTNVNTLRELVKIDREPKHEAMTI